MHDYNSTRKPIVLKEYGRNIQKLVEALPTIADKAARTTQAKGILNVMTILDNNSKRCVESMQKRWDDLFIISDYNVELDSPYPVPEKGGLAKALPRPSYNKQPLRFRNYGRNVAHLIQKAIQTEDLAEQEKMVLEIARLMKTFSNEGNNETILANLKQMSNNELKVDLKKVIGQSNFLTNHHRHRNNNRKKRTS